MRSPYSDQRETVPPVARTLQGGRYRLLEQQGQRYWSESVYERWWLVQDLEAADSRHQTICEVVLPESGFTLQKKLQPAIKMMLSIGSYPSIARLVNVFQEGGHAFFVFEKPLGESLQNRMLRTRRILTEQEVITCCLHIVEVLDFLSRHAPPIVHGCITPEHIVAVQVGTEPARFRWVLTNFSLTVACGTMPSLASREGLPLSPFFPTECARGIFNAQTDLYALLAVAYYAITGVIPMSGGGIIPARQINPAVSQRFSDLLEKGLAPVAQARFQQPSELYQTLGGNPAPDVVVSSGQRRAREMVAQIVPEPVLSSSRSLAQSTLPSIIPSQPGSETPATKDERSALFPIPEKLPLLQGYHDVFGATGWIIGILLCEVILLVAAR
jgi:serine/threonine protein kinase